MARSRQLLRFAVALGFLTGQPFNLSNAQPSFALPAQHSTQKNFSFAISLQRVLLQISPLPGIEILTHNQEFDVQNFAEELIDVSKDLVLSGNAARQVYNSLSHAQRQTVVWDEISQTLTFPSQKSSPTSQQINNIDLQTDLVLSQA